MTCKYLVFDVGSTNIQYTAATIDGKLADTTEVKTRANWSKKGFSDLIDDALSKYNFQSIAGIGIGLTGLVDTTEKQMIKSTQTEEMGFQWLEDKYQTSVVVENDCNTAVLGEKEYGGGKEYKNVVTVMMGTGIGCGVIYEDELLRSSIGGRGTEIGFTPLTNTYNWTDVCGGDDILTYISDEVADEKRETELHSISHPSELFELRDSDSVARECIQDMIEMNARGIATTVNAYAPELVTFAGSVATENTEFMRDSFEKSKEYIINPTPKMEISTVESDIGLYGALALIKRSTQD